MAAKPRTALSSGEVYPPRTVHDESGSVVGVILAVNDYNRFLRLLVSRSDWEDLPTYLQDAVDNLLADEATSDDAPPRPLRELLRETGDLPPAQ